MHVSRFQNFLGGLIERNPDFFIRLGRIENQWLQDSISEIEVDRPIYVSGLARSGSTILLELLASHPDIASQQYRDFPLIHTPVWWNWFIDRASSKNQEATERAHGDRIKVSPESPEAMEEVIWMAFFSSCHDSTKSNVLDKEEIHQEFEAFYQKHIRKILLVRGGSRYLAKGNYNISRIAYINRLFPDARFIIPFRDPVSHIASLMKQHRLFCDVESKDPKILAHMQRSGHFEFGIDLRPINFGCHNTVLRIKNLWRDAHDVRGWAAYWASAYTHIAELVETEKTLDGKILLVSYSDFCNKPAFMLQRIYKHCGIEIKDNVLQKQALEISAPDYYKSDFSESDIEIIHEETGSTVDRIQRLLSISYR